MAEKIISKGDGGSGGRIEDWEFLGTTDDVDWDLDMNLRDLHYGGKYVVLRVYGKSMDPTNIVVLKNNGEITRGGSRMKFRCVERVEHRAGTSKSPSKSSKSPKRCPNGSRRDPKTGLCKKY